MGHQIWNRTCERSVEQHLHLALDWAASTEDFVDLIKCKNSLKPQEELILTRVRSCRYRKMCLRLRDIIDSRQGCVATSVKNPINDRQSAKLLRILAKL